MSFLINTTTKIDGDRLTRLNSGATGSRPAAPSTGMMFFNTTTGKIEVWNGSAWKEGATTAAASTPSAWAWGDNDLGQLGDGTTSARISPVTVVGGFNDWVQLTGGVQNAAGIRKNGTIWCWGKNSLGELGNGNLANTSSPVSVVGGFTDWVQVDGGPFGSRHKLAIRANGTAWAWGYNFHSRLGDGTATTRSSPVSVVGGFTDWVQVSVGGAHSAGIRANGTAWCWGLGQYGRLGNNSTATQSSPVSVVGGFTNWVQITAGYRHVSALRSNGTIWGWGSGGSGQMGNGTVSSINTSPVSVIGGFTDWTQVSAGENHVAAIRANGTAWCWGSGTLGQLGQGTVASTRSSPVSVVGGFTDWVQIAAGSFVTRAIRANGTAWGWGVGRNTGSNTTTNRSSPVSVVGGFTDWVQISGRDFSAVAIRSQPKYKN